MAKILLVDDEVNIRKGLEAIIRRGSVFFSEIHECSNGREALQELKQSSYDLVITDIRMPDMDGIELIRNIRALNHSPCVVVLSGYSDFSYAQEAIRHGAKAYLLKPVDRNELLELLQQISKELTAEKEEKSLVSAMVTELLQSRLKNLITDEERNPEEVESLLNALGVDQDHPSCSVSVVNSCSRYACREKSERSEILLDSLRALSGGDEGMFLCCMDHDMNIVVMHTGSSFLNSIIPAVEKTLRCSCTVGTAHSDECGMKLHVLYRSACDALRHSFLYPGRRHFSHEDIIPMHRPPEVPRKALTALIELTATDRVEDMQSCFHSLFDEEQILSRGLACIEALSSAFRSELIQYLDDHVPHGHMFVEELDRELLSISEYADLHEYLHATWDSLLKVNEFFRMLKKTYSSDEIDRAIDFIHQHYMKDLTMAEVANSISMNYSYFSVLFKEKTGSNFVEYLRALRISTAKELLRSGESKIYEVAGKVGFTNPKHFSTTFKSITGLTPMEYKETAGLEKLGQSAGPLSAEEEKESR